MLYARPEDNSITVSPLNEDQWLKESFITHNGEHVTVDSLITSLESAPVASCHWLPAVAEFMIHGSHWRPDGIGSLKLADRLLVALSAAIRLDEISNGYTDEESTPSAVKKVADNLIDTVLKGALSIGLPLTSGTENALPGPSSRVRITLDKDTTQKVVATCKTLGIKVTSAVHAAIVQAVTIHAQHTLAKHYCITTAINLRRRLPDGNKGSGPELAAGMFISPGLVFIEEPGTEGKGFDAIARKSNATYAADMSRLYECYKCTTIVDRSRRDPAYFDPDAYPWGKEKLVWELHLYNTSEDVDTGTCDIVRAGLYRNGFNALGIPPPKTGCNSTGDCPAAARLTPVILSEFGQTPEDPSVHRNELLNCIRQFTTEYGVSWMMWSLAGYFRVRHGIQGFVDPKGIFYATWDGWQDPSVVERWWKPWTKAMNATKKQ